MSHLSSSLAGFLPLCAVEQLDGDEYLDITGIMRNQAGRYECKASNHVSTPDVKYVNVVVNCKILHDGWMDGWIEVDT